MSYQLNLTQKELDRSYFISDLHFNHKSIIEFDNRPYSDVDEMNEDMIRIWNITVRDNGIVFILGDLFFKCSSGKMKTIMEQLNGERFYFVIGNHDKSMLKCKPMRRYFELIETRINLYSPTQMIVLDHYPILEWDGYYRGSYHLYGHVHGNRPHFEPRAIDVSWRVRTKPLHYSRIEPIIKERKRLSNQ